MIQINVDSIRQNKTESEYLISIVQMQKTELQRKVKYERA